MPMVFPIIAGIVLIVLISKIFENNRSRGASRGELDTIKQDISLMKADIEDLKEQLADIIIRMD